MRAWFLSAYSLGRRSAIMLSLLVGMLAFPIGCGAERDATLRSDADEK